jgi:hypothetical protein
VSFAPLARAQKRAVADTRTQTGLAFLSIQMPEPPGPAVLATEFSSVGALIFLFRRRNR